MRNIEPIDFAIGVAIVGLAAAIAFIVVPALGNKNEQTDFHIQCVEDGGTYTKYRTSPYEACEY